MRNYKSSRPSPPFHMVEKEADADLGANAYYLYIKLINLGVNEDNCNDVLKQKTGFGERRFLDSKNKLIDKGYLDTRQVYGNKYLLYIGKESVRRYRASKYKKDNRHEIIEMKKIKESIENDKV